MQRGVQAPCRSPGAARDEAGRKPSLSFRSPFPAPSLRTILQPLPPERDLPEVGGDHRRSTTRRRSPGTDQKLIVGKGRFSIPESCYIDDTGHFNAVEFNICYNQLAYVLFAGVIDAGLMHKVRAGDVRDAPMARVQAPPAARDDDRQSREPLLQAAQQQGLHRRAVDQQDLGGRQRLVLLHDHHLLRREGVKAKGSVTLAFSPSYNPNTVH